MCLEAEVVEGVVVEVAGLELAEVTSMNKSLALSDQPSGMASAQAETGAVSFMGLLGGWEGDTSSLQTRSPTHADSGLQCRVGRVVGGGER